MEKQKTQIVMKKQKTQTVMKYQETWFTTSNISN